jgi:hypothetical protein
MRNESWNGMRHRIFCGISPITTTMGVTASIGALLGTVLAA